VGAIVVGLITVLMFSWLVHATEAELQNDLGADIYPLIPRGWFWTTAAQFIAVNGAVLMIAGATVAFVWSRPLTWARAAFGAFLFTALMVIVFGIIPNQLLTLFQGPLAWTKQKIVFTVPPALVLNNDLSISAETLKDMLVAGFYTTNFVVVAAVMVLWQNYQRKKAEPKPQKISEYGRPLRVES
jgi:hypothetical protein